MTPPKKSLEIFRRLQDGCFITRTGSTAGLYELLAAQTQQYRDYFLGVGYGLESGDGYFYFTEEDTRSRMLDKMNNLVKYLLCYDFLLKVDTTLCPGCVFSRRRVVDAVENYAPARSAASAIVSKYVTTDPDVTPERTADAILDILQDRGFIDPLPSASREYAVTEALHYLEWIMDRIDLGADPGEDAPSDL